MSNKYNKVLSTATIESFWGLEQGSIENFFPRMVFELGGQFCITEQQYLGIREYLSKKTSNRIIAYDKGLITRTLLKRGVAQNLIDLFLVHYKPMVEPFTGHLMMLKDFEEVFNQRKHIYENRTLENLSNLFGFPKHELYGLAVELGLDLTLSDVLLSEQTYLTLLHFFDQFALVKSGVEKSKIKNLGIPLQRFKFVGDFVDKSVLNYIRKGSDMPVAIAQQVKNFATVNGVDYLLRNNLANYLTSKGVKFHLRTLAESKLLDDNVSDFGGMSYLAKEKVDYVVDLYNQGFSLSYALALAYGAVTFEELNQSLTTYQVKTALSKLVTNGLIKKAFSTHLITKGLTYTEVAPSVRLYSVAGLISSVKTHISGVSPLYTEDTYVSAYKFINFLNEVKPEGVTSLPEGIYRKGDTYALAYNPVSLISVSATVLVFNKKLISPKLFEMYKVWLDNQINPLMSEVERIISDVRK